MSKMRNFNKILILEPERKRPTTWETEAWKGE